jgi:hypothetical protein
MGFSPQQVDLMTLWEFNACADAFAKSKGVETARPADGDISDARLREMGIDGFNGT